MKPPKPHLITHFKFHYPLTEGDVQKKKDREENNSCKDEENQHHPPAEVEVSHMTDKVRTDDICCREQTRKTMTAHL